MSNIDKLRSFLSECPFLRVSSPSKTPKLYVDYLSDKPVNYEVQVTPVATEVRKYVDGGGINQTAFAFRSLQYYTGKDIQNNIDNIAFFEDFANWLRNSNAKLPVGWISVETLTDGYIMDISESQDIATYQMQCRFLYVV